MGLIGLLESPAPLPIAMAGLAGLAVFLAWRLIRKRVEAAARGGRYKAVLLVRSDLGMEKGKVLSQGLHAAYELARRKPKHPEIVRGWERAGAKKVVLKVGSEEEMEKRASGLRRKGIEVVEIRDAGRTQVAPGSWTVSMAGPADEAAIDEVTGDLRLY